MPPAFDPDETVAERLIWLTYRASKHALKAALYAFIALKVFIAMGYVLAIVETPDDQPAKVHVLGQDYGTS